MQSHMKIFFPTALAFLHLSCIPAKLDTAKISSSQAAGTCLGIVNGQETTDFPSVVFLINGAGACTGTFVGHNTVLTAAHCLDPQDVQRISMISDVKIEKNNLKSYPRVRALKVFTSDTLAWWVIPRGAKRTSSKI